MSNRLVSVVTNLQVYWCWTTLGATGDERSRLTRARLAPPRGLAFALGLAAVDIGPRPMEAERLLAAQDHPATLADYALDGSFDAAVAAREINAALAANDADLARSFL